MKRGKAGKSKKVQKKVLATEKAASIPRIEQEEAEKPFDFGGLPDRDLKKNLGCG
jgi:hypothetical protein